MTIDLQRVTVADAEALMECDVAHPVFGYAEIVQRTESSSRIDLLRMLLGYPVEVFDVAVRPVIEHCAEFVQRLPAMESLLHRRLGGRFIHALELALRALHYRRGCALPRGVPPEIMGEHVHRWSYGVFIAALLHSASRVMDGIRVELVSDSQELGVWVPIAGSVSVLGATAYRTVCTRDPPIPTTASVGLAAHLYGLWVPASVRDWVDQDAGLARELADGFAGACEGAGGAIAGLVHRALGLNAVVAESMRSALAESTLDRSDCGTVSQASASEPADTIPAVRNPEAVMVGSDARLTGVVPPDKTDGVATDAVIGGTETRSTTSDALPPVAQAFGRWLTAEIAAGAIWVNAKGGMVYGVAEGMLLVSPRIFQAFASSLRRDPVQVGVALPEGAVDAVKWVQREVLRARRHLRGSGGATILEYRGREGKRKGSRIFGVVIREPGCLGIGVIPIDGTLVRVSEITPER